MLALSLLEKMGATPSRDLSQFANLCSEGKLYEELMRLAGFKGEREKFKPELFSVLFGMRMQAKGSTVAETLQRYFPTVWEAVVKAKAKDHRSLSRQTQRLESQIMLEEVCGRIPLDVPLFTVHDSIYTTLDNLEVVEQAIMEGFLETHGITPTLSFERFSSKDELSNHLRAVRGSYSYSFNSDEP